MPRKPKGARLYWRDGRDGRQGQFVILDTRGIERKTGASDRREAEIHLARYIEAKAGRPSGPTSAEGMTVSQALTIYGEDRAPNVADPARIGYAIAALDKWWGDRPVSHITGATCRRYAAERGVGSGTIRRELGTLRAALVFCHKEGHITHAPAVVLPDAPPPRDRWLTREEATRLIEIADSHEETKHLGRFIRIALYTGTRAEAILSLRFERHPGGGWIDVENGVLHRKSELQAETKKRRGSVRLPNELATLAREWSQDGGWVVGFRGAKVGSIKTAWRRICREAGLSDVTRHTLKHTAITWAMQLGMPLNDAAQYFSTSRDTLERVYWHHHPDYQNEAAATMGALWIEAKGK